VYSLGFQPTIEFPTAIPRKEITRLVVQRKIGITEIKYLKEAETEIGNCITVNAEDGMYLCSKSLLPTHNSSIINIAFPIWSWLQNPETKFITAAHGESLAVRDSVKSRQLIESPWFQRNWGDKVKLKVGSNQKTKYENTDNGYRIATSIGGRAVGEGFDCLIVDDPHKPVEINSRAALNKVTEWWTGTMPSRANSPTSRRVVMHQRLSDMDLIGTILETDEAMWEVIRLPMEYEPTTFVSSIGWSDPRTQEGEILWPERFPPFEVTRLKKELGSYGFAAHYQQRPAAKEGGIIKRDWINYYPTPFNSYLIKDFNLIIQSWDLSFSNTGDYTVGQVWGKKGPHKYLLDEVRGKWTFTEQLHEIRNLKAKWPQTRIILVENAANGAAAIDSLRREIPGLIAINPKEIGGGDKETRVAACSLDFEAGNIYIPSLQIAEWVKRLCSRINYFPQS
jgi:predicted phage terminase large subunit-like protein